MAEKDSADKKKKPGKYNRVIIACLDEVPIMSHIDNKWRCEDGRTLEELAGFRLDKFISQEDRRREVAIPFKGSTRNIKIFVRLEDGFQSDRLDDLIAELNAEFRDVHPDCLEETYCLLTDEYWEKAMKDKKYGRRLPDGNFDFDDYKGYELRERGRRKDFRKEDIMSDDRTTEAENEERINQRVLRPTRQGLSTAALKSSQDQPRSATASVASSRAPSVESSRSVSRQPSVEPPTKSTSFLEEVTFAKPTTVETIATRDPNTTFAGYESTDDELNKGVEKTSSQASAASIASIGGTPNIFNLAPQENVTFLSPTTSANVVQVPYDPNNTFAALDAGISRIINEGRPSVANQILLDVSDGSQIITKQNLTDALEEMYEKIRAAAIADKLELLGKMDSEKAAFKKKLDNKFQHVLDVKKIVQDLASRLANFKQQVAQSSPAKSFAGQIDLRSKARVILFRHLRFNLMGVCCDIYFASHFVQEQICAYIFPHLRKVALGGMNYAVGKTCLMTCFTPLARAHLIYGKIKNSTKNLRFNKRPIPEGLHNMIDHYLIPALEDVNKVARGSEAAHISNIRQTCASTFSTDRNVMIVTAITKTHTPREAAEVIVDCDFEFYEKNKHHLSKKCKVPSRDAHLLKTLDRAEFGKFESMPGTEEIDKSKIFESLTATSSNEIFDPREMLRQIIVAAYLFEQDYRNLKFDQLKCYPQLQDEYREVLHEITDINALVQVYSADAKAHLPEVVVGSPLKPNKRQADKSMASSAAKKGRLSPSLMTDDSYSSSDEFRTPTSRANSPPVRQPPAPAPATSSTGLRVLLPKIGIPKELMTSSSSENEPSTSKN